MLLRQLSCHTKHSPAPIIYSGLCLPWTTCCSLEWLLHPGKFGIKEVRIWPLQANGNLALWRFSHLSLHWWGNSIIFQLPLDTVPCCVCAPPYFPGFLAPVHVLWRFPNFHLWDCTDSETVVISLYSVLLSVCLWVQDTQCSMLILLHIKSIRSF